MLTIGGKGVKSYRGAADGMLKKYLLWDQVRMEVVSYGEEKPAASGFDENSRAPNRRVEFMSLQ